MLAVVRSTQLQEEVEVEHHLLIRVRDRAEDAHGMEDVMLLHQRDMDIQSIKQDM